MKEAMKARDSVRVQCLRGAMAACTNELVAKGKKPTDEVTDADAMAVLKRLVKQRKDSAEQYTKGNRPELAEKEMIECKIIESYLPQMASRDEIEKVVAAKLAGIGALDAAAVGKLTGAVMKELGGNADGNEIKNVIEALRAKV